MFYAPLDLSSFVSARMDVKTSIGGAIIATFNTADGTLAIDSADSTIWFKPAIVTQIVIPARDYYFDIELVRADDSVLALCAAESVLTVLPGSDYIDMTTLFPGALDNFTDPTGTAMLGATTPKHSEHHANINDAIEAIEATIGETGSTDPASVEKRLVDVISAAASAAADATSAQAAAALVALDLASLDASIGTAGYLDVGTGPNNVVQLDGSAKLPSRRRLAAYQSARWWWGN